MPECFLLRRCSQVVREASSRVLNLRPFDVQLIGGMILHEVLAACCSTDLMRPALWK